MVTAKIEPTVRRYQASAGIESIQDLWGDRGVDDVRARVALESLPELFGNRAPSTSFFPVRHLINLGFAVWEGPARRDRDRFARYLQRQADFGFGRVRRAVLSLYSPTALLERAPELWSRDNDGGTVTTEVAPHEATWRLVRHPYCEAPQTRASMAEAVRYCVELTRARNVTESHLVDREGGLLVRVKWQS
jgi:hypothetical protein